MALNALTPLLFLPAWPVAVVAGVTRRWTLGVAALVVAVAHVAFVTPELSAREKGPAISQGALRFRLFSANVFAGNPDAGGIAGEIRAGSPDVVFLQEATPAFVDALDRDGVLGGLPHRVSVARTDPAAGLLASRWPLEDREVVEVDGRPVLIRATAMTELGPVRLYSVHVVAPVGGGRGSWARGLDRVASIIRSDPQPVLMAGDFNATWSNRGFRDLLEETGLTDGAAARGRALDMTWPNDRRPVPALFRIDHVLTSRGLAVVGLRTGRGEGSDHRPLVADVARTG